MLVVSAALDAGEEGEAGEEELATVVGVSVVVPDDAFALVLADVVSPPARTLAFASQPRAAIAIPIATRVLVSITASDREG
jgi:hypothetical protein